MIFGRLFVGMPAYAGNSNALATKLVSVYPDNAKKGLPSHLCHILLFNPEDGTLKAVSSDFYYIIIITMIICIFGPNPGG